MWRGVDGWESVERCGTLSMLCGYVIYGNKEVIAVHTDGQRRKVSRTISWIPGAETCICPLL